MLSILVHEEVQLNSVLVFFQLSQKQNQEHFGTQLGFLLKFLLFSEPSVWNAQTFLNKRIQSLTRIMSRFVFPRVLSDAECCFIEWPLLMSIAYIEWNSLKKAFTRTYINWMHYSVRFDDLPH